MSKPAARLTDVHVCPKVNPGPVPHVGGPVVQGSADVIIGALPAARVGDMALCVGPPDKIVKGSSTVLINGKPAARMGDRTAHGGVIVGGQPTVLIGDSGGSGSAGGAGTAAKSSKSGQGASSTGNAGNPFGTAAADPIAQAIAGTRSPTEAIGNLGMQAFTARAGIQADPGFVKRYHGPDDLARNPEGGLVGLEAKGSQDGKLTIASHKGGVKQQSKEANMKRAKQMLAKRRQGKVDNASERQGGMYTEEEMTLYDEVYNDEGEKTLISTHTHTGTGQVVVVERNKKGNIKRVIDTFKISNFNQAKAAIEAHFA